MSEERVIAQREITNTYREKIKDLDGIKKGIQNLIDGLDNPDNDIQKGYDNIADDIKKQKDQFKNLAKEYDTQVTKREKAANDVEAFLNDLEKPKISDETVKGGDNNDIEYEEVDEEMKEWEVPIEVDIPELELPDIPDLRDPLEIEPFNAIEMTPVPATPEPFEPEEEEEKKEEVHIEDPKELIFSDEEEAAPDENIDDIIAEEKKLEEQLKNESIDKLLDEPITDPEAKKILGDPKKYDLPKENPGKAELEKDFEEISKNLVAIADDKMRKYAKLSALKDYQKIYDTYRRYCHAGADMDWMNRAGWNSFIFDSDTADKDGACDKKWCGKLHRVVYNHYHKVSKQRAKREREKKLAELRKDNPDWDDDDPWTGQWIQVHSGAKNKKNAASETYHIKEFGVKLVGFIKVPEFCEITGHVDEFAFLKGSYELRWKSGARAGQRRLCEVHLEAPEKGDTRTRMVVNWREINLHSKNKGSYTMVKIDKKTAVNEKNVKIDIGLARHEFFDATMRLSKQKPKFAEMEEYAALDGYTKDHILDMIWDEKILFPTEGNKQIKATLKKFQQPVRKLFNVYCSWNTDSVANDELLGDDEWEVWAKHVSKSGAKEFKIKGSAPSKIQIYSAFNWALKLEDYEMELTYQGYERAVLNYIQAMFRKRRGANYKIMPYMDKLKLFGKVAERLYKKPIKK